MIKATLFFLSILISQFQNLGLLYTLFENVTIKLVDSLAGKYTREMNVYVANNSWK